MTTDPASTPSDPPAKESAAAADSSAAKKKPRNPTERLIVWGLIAGMLVVCGREAVARFGYTSSLKNLQTAMEGDERGEVVKLEDVGQHLSGFPTREEHEGQRIVSYHWSGFVKDYGSIHLFHTQDNEILGLETADAEPEPVKEPEVFEDESDEASDADELSGGGGFGGGDRGSRPQRPVDDGDDSTATEASEKLVKPATEAAPTDDKPVSAEADAAPAAETSEEKPKSEGGE